MTPNFTNLANLARSLKTNYQLANFHISFVLYKNKPVVVGLNNRKTHPLNLRNPKISSQGENVCSHKFTCSELNAAVKLKNLTNIPFNKCTLVNMRVMKNGSLGYSAPCQSCRSLLSYLDLKAVYYTDTEGIIVRYY